MSLRRFRTNLTGISNVDKHNRPESRGLPRPPLAQFTLPYHQAKIDENHRVPRSETRQLEIGAKINRPQTACSAKAHSVKIIPKGAEQRFKIQVSEATKNEKLNLLKHTMKLESSNILTQMMRADKDGDGLVKFATFKTIANGLLIPESALTENNIERIYSELGGQKQGIDIKECMNNIASIQGDLVSPPSTTSMQRRAPSRRPGTAFSNASNASNVILLNPQKVPINGLEGINKKVKRISTLLRNLYKNKHSFIQALQPYTKGEKIYQSNLYEFISEAQQQNSEVEVTKKAIEGFMSVFLYNGDKATTYHEIAETVFNKEYSAMDTYASDRRNQPPDVSKSYKSEQHSDLCGTNREELTRILSNIENKVFNGPTKYYAVFKQFDNDGDGYISKQDLESALQKLKIPHNSQETKVLMDFLDGDKNGFIQYAEFAEKIQPNILKANAARLQLNQRAYTPATQPNPGFTANKKVHATKNTFPLAQSLDLPRAATRFGSRPMSANTFSLLKPPKTAGGYIDEAQRFAKGPISLAGEDKQRVASRSAARQQNIRQYRDQAQGNALQAEERAESRQQNRIERKIATQEHWENRLHSYNG